MKKLFLTLVAFTCIISFSCKKENSGDDKIFKGRLEIAGPCGNSTVSLLEGSIDSSKIMDTWQNPADGKVYHHVFRPGNACQSPLTGIHEGDEFYFAMDSAVAQNCLLCTIFVPTPNKTINIKVVNKK